MNDVNEKRGKFLHQSKLRYKEDHIRDIVNGGGAVMDYKNAGMNGRAENSNSRGSNSTQSDDYLN